MHFARKVAVILLLAVVPVLAQSNPPAVAYSFNGNIQVSTNPELTVAYITVTSQDPTVGLQAGFVVQFAGKAASPIVFTGSGSVIYTDADLTLQPIAGTGWRFQVRAFERELPSNVMPIKVAGVARYKWRKDIQKPTTHADFVSQREQIACLSPNSVASCDSCDSGGMGATSCSLDGQCSVTCGAGYFACCKPGAGGGCKCCANKW